MQTGTLIHAKLWYKHNYQLNSQYSAFLQLDVLPVTQGTEKMNCIIVRLLLVTVNDHLNTTEAL